MAADILNASSTGELTSLTIERLLGHFLQPFSDHVLFLGVFPFDYFPHSSFTQTSLQRSICCVVNNDPSTKPGQHWVALFRDKGSNVIEFFDSYGFPPEKYHFAPFSNFHVICNKITLQSKWSNVCGHYCVLFVYLRAYSVKTLKIDSRFKHVIDFLTKLSAGPTLNRDINVKRIIDRNIHLSRSPLITPFMHYVGPFASSSRTPTPAQSSSPFQPFSD